MSKWSKWLWVFAALVTVVLGYEYLVLNHQLHTRDLLSLLPKRFLHGKLPVSPLAGHPLSHALGWVGFSLILSTLLYSARKRVGRLGSVGQLTGWLEFHIIAGFFGPLLVVFHTNLKIGGLVAISFWSMVVCAASGVVGRYLLFKRYERLLGYWHSLHLPFAWFMYLVAAIHIVVALIFQVR